jgi:hypothetical protein
MSLKNQLNGILPGILSADPKKAMTANEIIARVRDRLRRNYPSSSIQVTLSSMANDPSSVILKREGTHGYFLKSAVDDIGAVGNDAERDGADDWSADEIVVATEACLRIADGEQRTRVTGRLIADLRRRPEDVDARLVSIDRIRRGLEDRSQSGSVGGLVDFLVRSPRSGLQRLAERATSLWELLRNELPDGWDVQESDDVEADVEAVGTNRSVDTQPTAVVPPRGSGEPPSRVSTGSSRVGIHFVCRNDVGVTILNHGRFQSRAWRVAETTASTAEYIALHQGQGERSYRQGRIVAYDRDAEHPDRFVFTCDPEDTSLPWPGPTGGGPMMVINRP